MSMGIVLYFMTLHYMIWYYVVVDVDDDDI